MVEGAEEHTVLDVGRSVIAGDPGDVVRLRPGDRRGAAGPRASAVTDGERAALRPGEEPFRVTRWSTSPSPLVTARRVEPEHRSRRTVGIEIRPAMPSAHPQPRPDSRSAAFTTTITSAGLDAGEAASSSDARMPARMMSINVSWSNCARLRRSSAASCQSVSSSQSSAGCRTHCTPRRPEFSAALSSALTSCSVFRIVTVIPSAPSRPILAPRFACAASSAGFAPSGSRAACQTSACTRRRSADIVPADSTSAASATWSSAASARRATAASASTMTRAASTPIAPASSAAATWAHRAGQLLALQRQPTPQPKPEPGAPLGLTGADPQLVGEQVDRVALPLPLRERRLADLLAGPPRYLARERRPARVGQPAEPLPRLDLLEQPAIVQHRRTARHFAERCGLRLELLRRPHAHIVTAATDSPWL